MQRARFKSHAEGRTCNPVQRPDFRGRAKLELECPMAQTPVVLEDSLGRGNKRTSAGDVEVTRAEGQC